MFLAFFLTAYFYKRKTQTSLLIGCTVTVFYILNFQDENVFKANTVFFIQINTITDPNTKYIDV